MSSVLAGFSEEKVFPWRCRVAIAKYKYEYNRTLNMLSMADNVTFYVINKILLLGLF